MKKIFSYLMKHKLWVVIGVIVVIIILIISFSGNDGIGGDTFAIEKGEVVSEVSVTGTVKPAQSVDLAFEKSGRISSILVDVGDNVLRGQLLAKLDNSDLVAQVMQSKASLSSEELKLKTLLDGARPEEIKNKELALDSAKEKLEGYYIDAINVVEDAFAKTNDAAKNKTDKMFDNDDSVSPQLTYSTADSQAKSDAQSNRLRSKIVLEEWTAEINNVKENYSENAVMLLLNNSKNRMNVVLTLLANIQDTLTSSIDLSQANADTYKTSISTARTNVITSMTNVDNQIQLINEQSISVNSAQNDLDLLKAGTREEDIDSQRAKVDYAEGQVLYSQAQLGKTLIYAPFSGIITKIPAEENNVVSANEPIVSVIGEGNYQIEANITESDIGKIRVGETAKITLDAYSNDVVFDAEVVKIDIGATIIEGVATYKTTLEFTNEDERILPGLTANVDILNASKEGILYVPTRNIITKDGKKFVKLINGDNIKEVEIEVGLRGSDGRTEVLKGLKEGDIIITE